MHCRHTHAHAHAHAHARGSYEEAVQLSPTLVDGRMPHAPSDFAFHLTFPASGSPFSGPWRCERYDFYDGRIIQIEFSDGPREWEPLSPLLPPPHVRSTYAKIPLCLLTERPLPGIQSGIEPRSPLIRPDPPRSSPISRLNPD